MKVRTVHPWTVSPNEAVELQRTLADRVVLRGKVQEARRVAACDVAYDIDQGLLYGAAIVWDSERGQVVDEVIVRRSARFPYVPGLLSFREAPVLLEALAGLHGDPRVVIVDGQGIAHPRGVGLASHLGLHIDLPTVGCAKSRLVGEHAPLGKNRGDHAWLTYAGQRVGAVLRSRTGVRPIYVSPGHRLSVSGALEVVLGCLGRYRLPEPVRQAHLLAERGKREH